ncbi:MAG: hypothetical protein JWL72_3938 [Ilumatobacteraceae bacterium]|nr:hypothetical protein [Ilumatobacteraceae bacterium]MCU1390600.1 hypothetical protein [Ilumatobacteraceae bacterium]
MVCSVALLSACGSDKGSSGAATTPATATTSTAAPQPTTAATEPTVTIATVVSPTDASTESPATEPTPTAGADTTEPTSGSTPSSAASADEFKEVAPPKVPTTSAPIAASGTQPDGVYYATVADNGDPLPADGAVVLEFVQLFRGDDCTAHFGTADTDSCVNDYGVVKDPTAAVEVPLGSQYITVSDAATQKSYQVTGTELYGLLHGDAPAAGAPDGYTYTGFGYVVTVAGGKVTRMEQWWTP